ncbi:hypothetical protein XENTR_v10003077 [Xenopus tropicalis]|nr:hypothetical protein XENTR_v10003077 [Xenopus tropicalis]
METRKKKSLLSAPPVGPDSEPHVIAASEHSLVPPQYPAWPRSKRRHVCALMSYSFQIRNMTHLLKIRKS